MFHSAYLNVSFSFLWAFVVSLFAIPSIIYLAYRKRILDQPNNRTVHVNLTPRLGGLAIFAGFMSAITLFGKFSEPASVQYLFAACILIFFIGLKDDILPVSAFKKFFIQVVAAFIVMFAGNIRLTSFYGFLGLGPLDDGSSYAITFLIIIGITNAINLIDGIDGLAGSILFFICCVLGFYFYQDAMNTSYYVICSCLAGSVLGFLRYNFGSARIFMGDTGSLVSGFIVAVLSIIFVETNPGGEIQNAPAIISATLFVPIVDTVRVFVIRILDGKSPFAPDKNHLHHRLMQFGFGKISTVITLVLLNLSVLAMVIINQNYDINVLMVAIFLFAVILSLFVELASKFFKTE